MPTQNYLRRGFLFEYFLYVFFETRWSPICFRGKINWILFILANFGTFKTGRWWFLASLCMNKLEIISIFISTSCFISDINVIYLSIIEKKVAVFFSYMWNFTWVCHKRFSKPMWLWAWPLHLAQPWSRPKPLYFPEPLK